MLLSDACLSIHGKYAKLKIQQKDKEFVMLLWNIFKEIGIVGAAPSECTTYLKETGKSYSSYQFVTFTHPFFTALYLEWNVKLEGTDKNVKIIPHNIAELLTPRALAYWLAGDDTMVRLKGKSKFILNPLPRPRLTSYGLYS
jgi:hypothetical protein